MEMEIKKNLLWVAALIGMLAIGTAVTITVSSEAEAIAELQKTGSIEKGKCTVTYIAKEATTIEGVTAKAVAVTFELHFVDNGEPDSHQDRVMVEENTESAIKTAVAKECDEMWAMVQANQKPVTVRIEYQNEVKSQFYDLGTKKWKAN